MTDERRNMLSASKIEAVSLCPGSWNAQLGLKEETKPDAPRDTGIKVHDALAGSTTARESLDSDQLAVFEDIEFKTFSLAESLGFTEYTCETRLWSKTLPISGKADRIYRDGKRLFIPDFKTGFLEAAPSPSNLQLRTLAFIAHEELEADVVFVAIIPRYGKPEVAEYREERGDFDYSFNELRGILLRAEDSDAPRNPGESQCRYCLFASRCPERNSLMIAVQNAKGISLPEMETADFVALFEKVGEAEKICEDIKAEAKRRAENNALPGWTLKEGSPREKIFRLDVVHSRCAELGISTEHFTDSCSLTKKALTNLVQSATSKKGKTLEALMDQLLYECVEPGKTPEPKLERTK